MITFSSQEHFASYVEPLLDTSWEAILPSINGYTPIVESITFSGTSLSNIALDLNSGQINYAGTLSNTKVNVTMYVDYATIALMYLPNWIDLIYTDKDKFNPLMSRRVYNRPQNYKKNGTVYFYGNDGKLPIYKANLIGMYPSSPGDFSLSYKDNPDRIKITGTFNVDQVFYEPLLTSILKLITTIDNKALISMVKKMLRNTITSNLGLGSITSALSI